jgi:hypothetical protein
MVRTLSPDQLASIKRSYLNILAHFLEADKMESRYLRCLLKWGFQLHITPQDLHNEKINMSHLAYTQRESQAEKLEDLYHLVYMIYLDSVVEDVELEVATQYGKQLGFNAYMVSELFNSIATSPYDEENPKDVKKEIAEFLRIHPS